MTSTPPDTARATRGLAEAMAKNEDATNAVQEVADELGIVHAVLAKDVAQITAEGDAANAVKRTATLEKKLTETAEKMVEVNEALAAQKASLEHLIKAK